MPNAELQLVSLSLLDDHPDNPRILYRDDVIDGIASNLNGEWPQQHAFHVRPLGDRFQILSGHTRKRAAEKCGIESVWVWVEEMDDAAAHMLLATANNQGELSPLEIGIHALKAVPTSKGGRGKKGGLSEYAEKVGKSQQLISQYRAAAEVAESIKGTTQVVGFIDKAKHLSEIHKLPRAAWAECCQWLAKHDASAADVAKRVAEAQAFLKSNTIAERWRKNYLPPNLCAARVFCGYRASNFGMLSDLATKVADELETSECQDLLECWNEWLFDNAGGDSWDKDKCQAKRIELDNERMEREAEPPSESVSVLLADPPWKYDFAETDNRQIENQYPTATPEEIARHIVASWAPQLAEDCVLFMWATAPKLREALFVMEQWGFEYKTHAVWDKVKIGMGYWFRGRHELLLVGTRGKFSPPEASERFASVFTEERAAKHSKKPTCVYEAIEQMFPDAVRFEMYQREQRKGWIGGGNEA